MKLQKTLIQQTLLTKARVLHLFLLIVIIMGGAEFHFIVWGYFQLNNAYFVAIGNSICNFDGFGFWETHTTYSVFQTTCQHAIFNTSNEHISYSVVSDVWTVIYFSINDVYIPFTKLIMVIVSQTHRQCCFRASLSHLKRNMYCRNQPANISGRSF